MCYHKWQLTWGNLHKHCASPDILYWLAGGSRMMMSCNLNLTAVVGVLHWWHTLMISLHLYARGHNYLWWGKQVIPSICISLVQATQLNLILLHFQSSTRSPELGSVSCDLNLPGRTLINSPFPISWTLSVLCKLLPCRQCVCWLHSVQQIKMKGKWIAWWQMSHSLGHLFSLISHHHSWSPQSADQALVFGCKWFIQKPLFGKIC